MVIEIWYAVEALGPHSVVLWYRRRSNCRCGTTVSSSSNRLFGFELLTDDNHIDSISLLNESPVGAVIKLRKTTKL